MLSVSWYMNKLILGVALLATLYMVFHTGRYYERAGQVPVNEAYNAGYRNGAYNVLAELVQCYGIDDQFTLQRYHTYQRLVNTLDNGQMDNENYPCWE